MTKPLGHCHHSLICKHILHHAFMTASAYSFHHSWIYYYSTLTAQSGNSEVDAIITLLQKSLVLLNKQSTWIIQPVAKYLLSCNIILSHNLNNCILPLLNEGLFNRRFYKWIWYFELWNDKSNDVQINCIYDICVSTFWNTGVKIIFVVVEVSSNHVLVITVMHFYPKWNIVSYNTLLFSLYLGYTSSIKQF